MRQTTGNTPEDTNRLLTIREVAAKLSMTPEAVRQRIKRGWFPSVKVGRQFRIKASVLRAYIESLPDGLAKDTDA